MASSLHVRNLDEELVRRLRIRAARNGRSAEAEHREILKQALNDDRTESWDEFAARVRAMTGDKAQTPSEVLLLESRDEAR